MENERGTLCWQKVTEQISEANIHHGSMCHGVNVLKAPAKQPQLKMKSTGQQTLLKTTAAQTW